MHRVAVAGRCRTPFSTEYPTSIKYNYIYIYTFSVYQKNRYEGAGRHRRRKSVLCALTPTLLADREHNKYMKQPVRPNLLHSMNKMILDYYRGLVLQM